MNSKSKLKTEMKPDFSPFTGGYNPLIQTKRFDIFHHCVVRNPTAGYPRELFTAWRREYDAPARPLCEVVLWPNPYGLYVEWVHVDEQHRRQGIATEVLRALREKFGELDMDGATDEGENFVAARADRINAPVKKQALIASKKKTKKVKRVARKRN